MPKWMPEIIRRDIDLFKKTGLQGLLSMAEYDNSILYEINNLAHFSMSWSSAWSSEELLDEYTEKTFLEFKAPARKQIDKAIQLMKPYANRGPKYPKELAPLAEREFNGLENSFRELSHELKMTGTENAKKSAVVLGRFADNMQMTSQHFALGPLFDNLLAACEKSDYDKLKKTLAEWREAKQTFYSSYKKLKGSGVCISDDVWTIGGAKTLFEYEDELENLIKTSKDSPDEIRQQLNKLQSWIC
jgi:hypothetical protein